MKTFTITWTETTYRQATITANSREDAIELFYDELPDGLIVDTVYEQIAGVDEVNK